jgi:hypothetical protein
MFSTARCFLERTSSKFRLTAGSGCLRQGAPYKVGVRFFLSETIGKMGFVFKDTLSNKQLLLPKLPKGTILKNGNNNDDDNDNDDNDSEDDSKDDVDAKNEDDVDAEDDNDGNTINLTNESEDEDERVQKIRRVVSNESNR